MCNTMKSITVCLPVYNGSEYIGECINSILHQTFKDFELLIVDDGSTDDTCAVIEGFDDPRIKVVRNRHDYIGSLNLMLSSADGKYIARIDADDIMMPDRLEYQYAFMEAHPEENMASVPELETKGLLCFNRELEVYIALRFEPDQVPDEDTLNLIAGSLQIGPVGTL